MICPAAFMKRLLFIFLLSAPLLLLSQTAKEWIAKGIPLMDAYKEAAALDCFVKALQLEPGNYEALWRCSLMKSHEGQRYTDPVKRANFLSSAKYLAQKAIEANPTHAEGYFCMSTAISLIALDSSTKEKVAASKEIKDFAMKAIQYDPNHAGAWHILGGWNYNVANLSSFERGMGKLLFGAELDGATVEKALSCYNKALAGKPTFIRYLYDKAECLYSMKLYDEAKKVLQTTLSTKVLSLDDPMILDKARTLMGKLD